MPRSKQSDNTDEPVKGSPEVSPKTPDTTEAAPKSAPVVTSQPASKKTPLKTEKLPSGAIIETF